MTCVIVLGAALFAICLPRAQMNQPWLFFGLLLLFRREWLSGSPQMFVVHYHMWLESSFGLLDQAVRALG